MSKTIVAVALTREHMQRLPTLVRDHDVQLTILSSDEIVLTDRTVKSETEQKKIRYRTPTNYISHIDPGEYYSSSAQCALHATQEVLTAVESALSLVYKDVSLLDLINTSIWGGQVGPVFRQIYLFEQILSVEHPDEVWICARPDWGYIVREPVFGFYGDWLDYRAMENEIMARVAHAQGVKVRYLRPSLDDWRRYVFTRWGRPWGIRAYKQFRLFNLKLGTRFRRPESSTQGNHPSVLAFTRSPVHSIRLRPVLEQLSRQGWDSLVVKDYSPMVRQLGRGDSSIPEINFGNWRGWHLYRHGRLAKHFRQWLSKHQADLPQVVYRNIDISDMLVSILWRLADLCVEACARMDDCERMLDACKPNIVLLANDHDLACKAMTSMCAQKEIPTLTVQHGLLANSPLRDIPVTADRYAAMGQMAADLLVRFGTPLHKIAITGVPGLDAGRSIKHPSTIPEGDKRVTLITQPHPMCLRYILPRFLQAARDFPEEQFIIRPSPRESMSTYRNSIPNVRIAAEESLGQVLDRSKLVIGLDSTAVLEAMQREIPAIVVQLLFENENPLAPAATVVRLDTDWTSVVQECLQNQEMRRAMIDRQNEYLNYLVVQDGKAVERIVSIIQEMAGL